MQTIDEGNPRSRIWIVGEALGEDEARLRRPFVGASGQELTRMLADAGIARSECFLTNVCHEQPPPVFKNGKRVNNDITQWFLTKTEARRQGVQEIAGEYPAAPIREGMATLHDRLSRYRPNLVIAVGNTPMWALSGNTGITKWRSSVLDTPHGKVIPTFNPADILRQWTHRPIAVQDFRRARQEAEFPHVRPHDWSFTIPRNLQDIHAWFHDTAHDTQCPLISDTEGWGRVDCIGFASSKREAICIPFTHPGAEGAGVHYWDFNDELAITEFVIDILRSRPIVFHNALWDCQVIARRWAAMPRLHADTQVMQHVCFPGLLGGKIDPVTGTVDKKGSSLSLSFIASMYCDNYCFWKDDGRTFDPAIHDENQLWDYNCVDCVRTYECFNSLSTTVDKLNLRDQLDIEMRLFAPVLRMMFRGVRYDAVNAEMQQYQLTRSRDLTREWLNTAVGCDFNPDSTPQMRALFYDDLQCQQIRNRKTGAPSLDDAALDTIARRSPLLRPLVSQIQNYRTLDTLRSALDVRVSDDGRIRSCFNIGFVETFRFSSNETAFGEGGNLQNLKRPDNE